MIIILTDGTRLKVPLETIEVIRTRITEGQDGGAKQYQFFIGKEGKTVLAFNLSNVSAICEEADIVKIKK